jgi:hypothetical protein
MMQATSCFLAAVMHSNRPAREEGKSASDFCFFFDW